MRYMARLVHDGRGATVLCKDLQTCVSQTVMLFVHAISTDRILYITFTVTVHLPR